MKELFVKFCSVGKTYLEKSDFHSLCKSVFLPTDELTQEQTNKAFHHFNKKKNGKLDKAEFDVCCKEWLDKVLNPKTAFLIVDVQNDFITGSLQVNNGAAVVPVINRLLDTVKFDAIVYTQDWHPSDHISFHCNVPMREIHCCSPNKAENVQPFQDVIFARSPSVPQTLWPAHCIQHSEGAKFHPDLKVVDKALIIHKGSNPNVDSYSTFFDNEEGHETKLRTELQNLGITDVILAGLAFDICVKFSALDARKVGFGCMVITDASGTVREDGQAEAERELSRENCLIAKANEVKAVVERKVRYPFFAFSDFS